MSSKTKRTLVCVVLAAALSAMLLMAGAKDPRLSDGAGYKPRFAKPVSSSLQRVPDSVLARRVGQRPPH